MRENKWIILVTLFMIGIIIFFIMISKSLYNSKLSGYSGDRKELDKLDKYVASNTDYDTIK